MGAESGRFTVEGATCEDVCNKLTANSDKAVLK